MKKEENMNVLLPREGYKFDFILNFAGIIISILLFLSLIYLMFKGSKITVDKEILFLIFILVATIFFLYDRFNKIGSYINISKNDISKPFNFKFQNPKYIPVSRIRYYRIIKREGDNKIKGIEIKTKDDEKVVYSENATPGCTSKIKNYLDKRGVDEKLD